MNPGDLIRDFGLRVGRERTTRRWSMQQLADKAGVSVSTVSRAERGNDVWLACAVRLAAALGVPLAALVAEADCAACGGLPPAGFTCRQCGRSS